MSSSRAGKQSFAVVVKDRAVYHACLRTLAMVASASDVPNFVRIKRVEEDLANDNLEPDARMLILTEDKIRGVNLEEMAKLWRRRSFRPLVTAEVACIAADILTCLRTLHQQHCIIHGAVNLQNILIDSVNGRAVLRASLLMQECITGETTSTPFFLRSLLRSLGGEERLNPVLKLYWSAPEVFSAGYVDLKKQDLITKSFSTDLFSLGVTLLHLVMPRQWTGPVSAQQEKDTGKKPPTALTPSSIPSVPERVIACVHALQCVSLVDPDAPVFEAGENADIVALAAAYGESFIEFIARCVQFAPENRASSAQSLLESDFIRENQQNAQGSPNKKDSTAPPPLVALMASVEDFMRDPVAEAHDWTPPTANPVECWAAPLAIVVSQPIPPVSPKENKEASAFAGIRFSIPEKLMGLTTVPHDRQILRDANAEAALPPISVVSPTPAEEEQETGNDDVSGALETTGLMNDSKYQRELREDCTNAIQSALKQTQVIMKEQYTQEKSQRVASARRAQQQQHQQLYPGHRPPSPQTPASAGLAGLSPRANNALLPNNSISNPRWSPSIAGMPSPHAGAAPPFITPSTPGAGPASAGVAKTPDVTRPAQEQAEATKRAEKTQRLLQRMAEEALALQRLAPDFSARFCEALAQGALRDTLTTTECMAAVEPMVPSLAADRKEKAAAAAAAAAEEAARLSEMRRQASRINYSKPMRTAEEWSWALSMPQANGGSPQDNGQSPSPLNGVGGAAAPLLYNKWLKEHQKMAPRML